MNKELFASYIIIVIGLAFRLVVALRSNAVDKIQGERGPLHAVQRAPVYVNAHLNLDGQLELVTSHQHVTASVRMEDLVRIRKETKSRLLYDAACLKSETLVTYLELE